MEKGKKKNKTKKRMNSSQRNSSMPPPPPPKEQNGGKKTNDNDPPPAADDASSKPVQAQPPPKPQQNFDSILTSHHIKQLEEPEMRKSGEYYYYCTHCEVHIRDRKQAAEHIKNFEHLANNNRMLDRMQLKDYFDKFKAKYGAPTPEHISALDVLSSQSYYESDEELHKTKAQEILKAVQATLQEFFIEDLLDSAGPMVQTQITGSFLTGLHCAKNDVCDLNIVAKFNETLMSKELGPVFIKACDALKGVSQHLTSPVVSPVGIHRMMSRYGVPLACLNIVFDQFAFNVSIGFGEQAVKAHHTTRLIFAYQLIWPPLKRLMRFVRCWAEINHLNFKACGGISNFAFDLLCVYYLQQTGYLPVLDELIEENLMDSARNPLTTSNLLGPVQNVWQLCALAEPEFVATCHQLRTLHFGEQIPMLSDGRLIFGFFKYFGTEFDFHTLCKVTERWAEKKCDGHKHTILLDPFLDCNVLKLRLEGNAHLWNCFIRTAVYLCTPRLWEGPLLEISFEKSEFEHRVMRSSTSKSTISYVKVRAAVRNGRVHSMMKAGNTAYDYTVDRLECHPGEVPKILCQYCGELGHCDWDCACVRPSPLAGLVCPIRRELDKDLSKLIKEFYRRKELTKGRKRQIDCYIQELRNHMRDELGDPKLQLTPFGSVVNGFGTNDCDLDLCLRSDRIQQNGEELIKRIDAKLASLGYKTDPVLWAKVPIVKFVHSNSEFRGDISVGNCLGLCNSEMLKTYTQLDSRVAPLGLFIKHWFKQHNLNSSPEGSFSSYSIIILLIGYLQQGCQPPVLPILQEMTWDVTEREMLDGWDVTFARPPPKYRMPGGKNEQSLAQLFFGFLRFYMAKFDPRMDVMQIRRSAPLLKMDKRNRPMPAAAAPNGDGKRWDQYAFCVEDPFDLNHNLCGGVKPEVVTHLYELLKRTLEEMALLDMKMDNWEQWARPTSPGASLPPPSVINLLRNGNGTNKNGRALFCVMPKTLDIL